MKQFLLLMWGMALACPVQSQSLPVNSGPETHADTLFVQKHSVKYFSEDTTYALQKAFTDRNGKIQILSPSGLQHLKGGAFLQPGTLVEDKGYRFMSDKRLVDMLVHENQFVYLDQHVVFSNAWAGKYFVPHGLERPVAFAMHSFDNLLVTDGNTLHYLQQGKGIPVDFSGPEPLFQVLAEPGKESYLLLSSRAVYRFSPSSLQVKEIFRGQNFSAMDLDPAKERLYIGTNQGYLVYSMASLKPEGNLHTKVPWPEITAVKVLSGVPWFGTSHGAFSVDANGAISYYASERWLPDDRVVHLEKGPKDQVIVLSKSGLSVLHFNRINLAQKAEYFEKQVRSRHIRNGFNATLSGMNRGDLSTGYLSDSDNDGLWTSLYLAGQAFRYAATGDLEALENCRESLEAMQRLFLIHQVKGFPARSFERNGHVEKLADPKAWQVAPHREWVWKSTTSSDEAIGHVFAYAVIAELVEDEALKSTAISLLDALMEHIVQNDLYLVDYDGKPTLWGRWNPEYVNAFPVNIGDRKLNSSNIIGMLQTAYHFTGKEKYKEKAMELLYTHGYLENLMRPMKVISTAEEHHDDWSKMLSSAWNHSDDEMYFAGYWGLYRYAFDEDLKAQFKASILDHWEFERPEKEGAWNIFTAITGVREFDLPEAVWYLQRYPLDLIQWTVKNSHRQDIQLLEPNFRNQFTAEVLPPDELKISRHNANRFILDGGSSGREENSAGDIWLFPYWMARYLGVILPPQK